MKKYLIVLFFILIGCNPDNALDPQSKIYQLVQLFKLANQYNSNSGVVPSGFNYPGSPFTYTIGTAIVPVTPIRSQMEN
jgi:hypothetical protein